MDFECVHMVVRGVVQGVGFRFFVVHAARRFDVAGWVRNAPDGSVEITAEGGRGSLRDFVADIQRGSVGATVRDVAVSRLPYQGTFKTFEVRY